MDKLKMSNKHLVFVYGTLKQNCKNKRHLGNSTFVGLAETQNNYGLFNYFDAYPIAIEGYFSNTIKGELYYCSHETINELDCFEGVPDLFYRKRINVIKDDYVFSAYMYFYNLNDIEDLFGLEEITEWKEGE